MCGSRPHQAELYSRKKSEAPNSASTGDQTLFSLRGATIILFCLTALSSWS